MSCRGSLLWRLSDGPGLNAAESTIMGRKLNLTSMQKCYELTIGIYALQCHETLSIVEAY